MAKTPELPQCDPADEHQRDAQRLFIGKSVLNALGKPSDLLQVQVRSLWDQHFRVNVVVGPDFLSSRIANSYFVKADEDGNVIGSTPPIKRQYDPAAVRTKSPSAAEPAAVDGTLLRSDADRSSSHQVPV